MVPGRVECRAGFIKRPQKTRHPRPAMTHIHQTSTPSRALRRSRLTTLGLALLVVALGLASRSPAVPRPSIVAAYAGDTLWALLVFLLVRLAAPRWQLVYVAGAALAFSFAIEASQLYHAPWLDTVRRTLPGRLVLGAGFLWSDLVCYTAGVLIGIGIDLMLLHRRRP